MRALFICIASASVVRRAESENKVAEVVSAGAASEAEKESAAPLGYVTQSDGSRHPFCTYRKTDKCESECGATELDGININLMQLGPKRCARCKWVDSKKRTLDRHRPTNEAVESFMTCGPDGVSVEEGIYWGNLMEKCCYSDVCYPEAMPCADPEEYRYEAYFGSQDPSSLTNHGPDGYVPPTRHFAGERVGVNQAWRHVDRRAGRDRLLEPLPMDEPADPRPLHPPAPPAGYMPMDPPMPPRAPPRDSADPFAGCALEHKLVNDCVSSKPPEQCQGHLELLRKCMQR